MPLSVGSRKPLISPHKTKTAEGLKDIKLSDNFGKRQTLLLFFPLAYTGTCTQEMCDMTAGAVVTTRDSMRRFTASASTARSPIEGLGEAA